MMFMLFVFACWFEIILLGIISTLCSGIWDLHIL